MDRLRQLYTRAKADGFGVFVVYADREHSANLAYLTGYDPRFEEALLIWNLGSGDKPRLLVGNEGMGYVKVSPIIDNLDVTLYQSFSLLGQARGGSPSLKDIFTQCGVTADVKVGVAGWKYFDEREADDPLHTLEIPSYIADLLRELAGDVRNAGNIFMNASDGLRAMNDVHQLARFEFAACYTSQALRNLIFAIEPGITELDAAAKMKLNGLPQSCHLMLSSGQRASLGLASPSTKKIEPGEPFMAAYGIWGALNCRAGFLVGSADELPDGIRDYVDKLVTPYFEAIVAWYEMVGIGVMGADLFRIINERLGDLFFGVGLNPGHLIHLDEWVHSPIYVDSTETLKSGMALQVDVIPATHTPYFTTNIEDGIALADDKLRAEFKKLYPEAWTRIEGRRAFMKDVLGITLKPEVLPLSNIPAYLPPYLLQPFSAMRMVE
jgi:Xaa-Pro aminopeptidase